MSSWQDRGRVYPGRLSLVCHAPDFNMTPSNPIKHDNPGLTYYSLPFFPLRAADKHSWFCVKERVKSPLLIPATTRSDWKVKETPHWSSSLMVFSLSGALASCLVRSSCMAGHYTGGRSRPGWAGDSYWFESAFIEKKNKKTKPQNKTKQKKHTHTQ